MMLTRQSRTSEKAKYQKDDFHPFTTFEQCVSQLLACSRVVDRKEQEYAVRSERGTRLASFDLIAPVLHDDIQAENTKWRSMYENVPHGDEMKIAALEKQELIHMEKIAALEKQELIHMEKIAALEKQELIHMEKIAALEKQVTSLQELVRMPTYPWQQNKDIIKALENIFGTDADDAKDTKRLDGILSDFVDEKQDAIDLVRSIRGR